MGDLIETVATAIAIDGFGRPLDDFPDLSVEETDKGDLREYAAAAIAAINGTTTMIQCPECGFMGALNEWEQTSEKGEAMSDDIVERLRLVADADCRETARDWTFEPADGHRWADLMDQAADEIKRLRAALRGCVEHMEHSTQQGREAWRTAQALLSPEGDVK